MRHAFFVDEMSDTTLCSETPTSITRVGRTSSMWRGQFFDELYWQHVSIQLAIFSKEVSYVKSGNDRLGTYGAIGSSKYPSHASALDLTSTRNPYLLGRV
jgi:hypothetical protein